MSNLAHVVQELRNERDQAQRRVEQLDEALKAPSGVDALLRQMHNRDISAPVSGRATR
jgi:hypothetical protein